MHKQLLSETPFKHISIIGLERHIYGQYRPENYSFKSEIKLSSC